MMRTMFFMNELPDDLDRHEVAAAVPGGKHVDLEHLADDDLALVAGLPKRTKVVRAEEVLRGRRHRLDVEVVRPRRSARSWTSRRAPFGPELPDLLAHHRVPLPSAAHEVAVALVGGVEARVVAAVAGLSVVDDDVLRAAAR